LQSLEKKPNASTTACLGGSADSFVEWWGTLSEVELKFAKIVFRVAAIYGVLALTPLYFLFDLIGRQDPPPITHPGFYYGFAGVALAWQAAFYVISNDPKRYRALMIPSVLEKFSFGFAVIVLVLQHRMHPSELVLTGIDLLLGLLFIAAYFKTPRD
jgi:hypothetical protein